MFRSGLLFAGAGNTFENKPVPEGAEDGVLTAYELSQMYMSNTKLTILSACQTGLGDVKGSEGVFGLQRALKMAGVDYLMLSLWKVPDKETQEMMILFYEKLIETQNIQTSFTHAQNEMKKKYPIKAWAAFVLIN